MGKMRKRTTKEGGVLSLSGKVTVCDVASIRKKVLTELRKTEELTIDLTKLDEGDLSFYQLLCSTVITAERMNKKLVCRTNEKRESDMTTNHYGFCNGHGCSEKGVSVCIWNRLN